MGTEVTFDYLLMLREILCEEISSQFKANGMAAEDRALHQQLFFSLLECMVLEESGIASKSSTIKSGKALMEYILGKVSDHVTFFCEVLNKYVVGSSPRNMDSADQALITQFLQVNAPHDLNQIFGHFEKQLDCELNKDGSQQALSLQEIYEKFLPKAVIKNTKQKPIFIKMLVQMIRSIISQNTKQGKKAKYEVDAGHLMHLLAQHLIFCPKIKFQAFCPDEGRQHKNSIKTTNELVQNGVETLALFLKTESVNAKIDLKNCRFELATIILAIILIEDQQCRQSALKALTEIAESD